MPRSISARTIEIIRAYNAGRPPPELEEKLGLLRDGAHIPMQTHRPELMMQLALLPETVGGFSISEACLPRFVADGSPYRGSDGTTIRFAAIAA